MEKSIANGVLAGTPHNFSSIRCFRDQTEMVTQKENPKTVISHYTRTHRPWRTVMKIFDAEKSDKLFRTISRMPDHENVILEDQRASELRDGKIPGYYIVSDSRPESRCIMLWYAIDFEGIRMTGFEHLYLDAQPNLDHVGNLGFYPFVCDRTQSTEAFMSTFEYFQTALQNCMHDSYHNPTTPEDFLFKGYVDIIKAVTTSDEFECVKIFDKCYAVSTFQGERYWTLIGIDEFFSLKNPEVILYPRGVADELQEKHQRYVDLSITTFLNPPPDFNEVDYTW